MDQFVYLPLAFALGFLLGWYFGWVILPPIVRLWHLKVQSQKERRIARRRRGR